MSWGGPYSVVEQDLINKYMEGKLDRPGLAKAFGAHYREQLQKSGET
jgi:hypothetical protein